MLITLVMIHAGDVYSHSFACTRLKWRTTDLFTVHIYARGPSEQSTSAADPWLQSKHGKHCWDYSFVLDAGGGCAGGALALGGFGGILKLSGW